MSFYINFKILIVIPLGPEASGESRTEIIELISLLSASDRIVYTEWKR